MFLSNSDSLYIKDSNGRVDVLRPDLAFVRTLRLTLPDWTDVAVRQDGSLVISRASGDAHTQILQVYSSQGELVLGHGAASNSFDKRRVAVDPSGNVWTVSPTEYLIEKRDSSLALARTFKRDLPKFRTREPYEWDPGTGSPVITHMYTASNRHLFVVVLLPTQVLPIGSSLPLSSGGTGCQPAGKNTPLGIASG
jgi:hypothetical protein